MASWRNGQPLRAGNIDVHAHMLPADCFGVPVGDSVVELEERDGELHLGDFPIAISMDQVSNPARILADMDEHDVAARVVSPPPYAFPVTADATTAADYCARVNDGIVATCSAQADRMVPLGMLPVQDEAATWKELRRLADLGVPGVAIPPVTGDVTLGDPQLRHVVVGAVSAGMSVLVHPMQQHRPGFRRHYLENIVGNPVESATAIASCVLSGVFDEVPTLRIVFVHGAGCGPALVGRWDHAWRVRADVSADTANLPSEVVRQHVYADTLTHSDAGAELLAKVIAPERIMLGSDYPFDMADDDAVGSATSRGFDLAVLRRNTLRWLGDEGQ